MEQPQPLCLSTVGNPGRSLPLPGVPVTSPGDTVTTSGFAVGCGSTSRKDSSTQVCWGSPPTPAPTHRGRRWGGQRAAAPGSRQGCAGADGIPKFILAGDGDSQRSGGGGEPTVTARHQKPPRHHVSHGAAYACSPLTHHRGSPEDVTPLPPPRTTVAVAALRAASHPGNAPFGSYLCPVPSCRGG